MVWQHWVNFIVGLWIILSAYIGMSAAGMVTNLTISGIIVAVLALWGALSNQNETERLHRHA
jgi:hypothetical protein